MTRRNKYLSQFILLLFQFVLLSDQSEQLRYNKQSSKHVTSVLDDLLKEDKYDKRFRPNYGGDPVTVAVNMYIKSLGPVSETDEVYSIDTYYRQMWYDKRLKFNISGLEEFSLNWLFLDKVWKPDTYFINGMKSYLHSITVPNKFLRLRNDGYMTYSMRLTIKASCPMNLRTFPLDAQSCPLAVGSYAYSIEDVKYKWLDKNPVAREEGVNLAQYDLVRTETKEEIHISSRGATFPVNWIELTPTVLPNRTYFPNLVKSTFRTMSLPLHIKMIISVKPQKNGVGYAFAPHVISNGQPLDSLDWDVHKSCSVGQVLKHVKSVAKSIRPPLNHKVRLVFNEFIPLYDNVSVISVDFFMKRHTGYFLLQVYVPCALIVSCSWVSFWIDPNAVPARVSLGVTTVLSMTTLGFGGRSQMPRTSYATALDWFVILCFAFVFASMVEYAVINFIDKMRKDVKAKVAAKNPKSGPPEVRVQDTSEEKTTKPGILAVFSKFEKQTVYLARITSWLKRKVADPYEFVKGPTGKFSKIDIYSRKIFPLSFATLNLIYWTFFLYYTGNDPPPLVQDN